MSAHTARADIIGLRTARLVFQIRAREGDVYLSEQQLACACTSAARIAQAPLLEALEALRLCADWLVSVGADGSPLTAVRAAIARAEGSDATP